MVCTFNKKGTAMRIESERMKEREATAELIRQLVRDDALRGEFMCRLHATTTT